MGQPRQISKQISLSEALRAEDMTLPRDPPERSVQYDSRQALYITLRDRLKHFTWAWFGMTMATGSLGVVLSITPNQFNGLFTIGKIVFLFDLVLFCTFFALIVTRFI